MAVTDDDTHPLPKKKARLSFQDQIKVVVGEEREEFKVRKNEICARSEFFKAARSERWARPNGITTVELLEDAPEIFNILLHCIFKDRVDIGDIEDPLPGENEGEAFFAYEMEHRLVNAYILADKLRDVVSANLLMDCLSDYYIDFRSETFRYCHIVDLVTNNSAIGSPMSNLILDLLSHDTVEQDIRVIRDHESIPREFICEMLIEKTRLVGAPTSHNGGFILSSRPKCDYHQRDELHPICCDYYDWKKQQAERKKGLKAKKRAAKDREDDNLARFFID